MMREDNRLIDSLLLFCFLSSVILGEKCMESFGDLHGCHAEGNFFLQEDTHENVSDVFIDAFKKVILREMELSSAPDSSLITISDDEQKWLKENSRNIVRDNTIENHYTEIIYPQFHQGIIKVY